MDSGRRPEPAVANPKSSLRQALNPQEDCQSPPPFSPQRGTNNSPPPEGDRGRNPFFLAPSTVNPKMVDSLTLNPPYKFFSFSQLSRPLFFSFLRVLCAPVVFVTDRLHPCRNPPRAHFSSLSSSSLSQSPPIHHLPGSPSACYSYNVSSWR